RPTRGAVRSRHGAARWLSGRLQAGGACRERRRARASRHRTVPAVRGAQQRSIAVSTEREKGRILVVDGLGDVSEALRLLFKSEGFATAGVDGPPAALEALRRQRFDIALIDLNYTRDTTSGAEGLELL